MEDKPEDDLPEYIDKKELSKEVLGIEGIYKKMRPTFERTWSVSPKPESRKPYDDNKPTPSFVDRKLIKALKETSSKRPEWVHSNEWKSVEKLKHSHKLACYMAAFGHSAHSIADAIGLSREQVTTVIKSDIGEAEIKRIQDQTFGEAPTQRFKKILNDAIDTAEDIMKDSNEKGSVRLNAAFGFMDRALGKPKQEIEHKTGGIRELFERLDQMQKQKTIEMKAEAIDGEIVPQEAIEPGVQETEAPQEFKDEVDKWIEDNLE